ncbi:MAG: hypothetical protein GYB42_00740 [Alphaproteobacteria bacterium]|nr:hypothetical protein [Alphaproteobacteria bacterium]
MKALSFASVIALALAGAACSESTTEAPSVDTPPAEASLELTQASADDGFNLMIPGEGPGEVADDGFNLAIPGDYAGTASDSFNLPSDLPSTVGLDAVPEVNSSILDEEPAASEDDDADEIIRLTP